MMNLLSIKQNQDLFTTLLRDGETFGFERNDDFHSLPSEREGGELEKRLTVKTDTIQLTKRLMRIELQSDNDWFHSTGRLTVTVYHSPDSEKWEKAYIAATNYPHNHARKRNVSDREVLTILQSLIQTEK